MLPDGVLEDDGADRGIVFVGAHPKRQFEFVKSQWLNDSIFIGAPAEKAAGPAAVRHHPRLRVLLRPGSARAALAGGAGHRNG
jgi:hypothetical protein